MFKKSIFLVLITITILLQGCGEKTDDSNTAANAMLSTNEYILTATDGTTQYVVKKEKNGFVVENAKGKVIIFDIFATWCPPCQAGATHLASLQKKFKDDLIILGITIEDGISNADLEDFKRKFNAQYEMVNSNQNRRLINQLATVLKLGDRFPIPIMAMYRDGQLINHYIGEVQEEFVESDIKKALGK